MLNCVFQRHIPPEIEFKSRDSDSNVQQYHPWAVRRLLTRKKIQKRGEFITPLGPTTGGVKSASVIDTVMAYFDQTKQTELITDASPWSRLYKTFNNYLIS